MTKPKQRKRTIARELTLQLLFIADANGDLTTDDIEYHFESEGALPEVADFTRQLVKGTMSVRDDVDGIIAATAVNWRLSRMSVVDRNILRMASYEILHMDDIPPKVSINEAVDLAKKFSTADSGAFVNGILDKILSSYGKGKPLDTGNDASPEKTT